MKKLFTIFLVCLFFGLYAAAHELGDHSHTHGDTPTDIIDHLVRSIEFKESEIKSLESLDIKSLDLFEKKLEKANNSFEAGRLINMSTKKLSQFKDELDNSYVQKFTELLLKKSKEFPEGLHGHYLAITSFDSRAAELLLPEMLKSDDPFIRMVAEKKVSDKRQLPNSSNRTNRIKIEKGDLPSVPKTNIKIKGKEQSQPVQKKSKSEKKSSLPWIVAGVLLVGILLLLFKVFKGKSTS